MIKIEFKSESEDITCIILDMPFSFMDIWRHAIATPRDHRADYQYDNHDNRANPCYNPDLDDGLLTNGRVEVCSMG
jgi:hypothetical protein